MRQRSGGETDIGMRNLITGRVGENLSTLPDSFNFLREIREKKCFLRIWGWSRILKVKRRERIDQRP